MLLESQKDRGKRFKAMLQYLILREAFKFDDEFSRVDSGAGVKDGSTTQEKEREDEFKKESAEKILGEMKLKFYDFFVEDDLVEDYLFFDVPGKEEANTKKDQFKTLIQEQISDKITVINSANTDTQNYKNFLKEIVGSPKIENSIMTCSMENQSNFIKYGYFDTFSISDIDDVFQLSNLNITDESLLVIRKILLPKSEGCELFKIEENSIAIHAHLNTATSLSLGFLNLTGKFIAKTLGDLSGGLFKTDINGEGKLQVDNASPSESVRGKKISEILNSLPKAYATQVYI